MAASATEDELAAEQSRREDDDGAPPLLAAAPSETRSRSSAARTGGDRSTPTACACCGAANRLRKLGEDVTQTLETTPRRWKVIETVREKFSCRDCETISQAPAPFHVIPEGLGGPEPAGDDRVREVRPAPAPLNRQAERYALEGAPIALSTMSDAWARSRRCSIRSGARSRPMSGRPSACTATTVCCGSTQKG